MQEHNLQKQTKFLSNYTATKEWEHNCRDNCDPTYNLEKSPILIDGTPLCSR